MPEQDRDERPEVPPPPPRQPDERLNGHIEGDNRPGGTADHENVHVPAR